VLPGQVAAVVGVVLLIGTALLVARRTDPRRPWAGAVVMVGVAFALGGVTYPWYALLLVALVALDGRAEWLGLAAAAYPGYFSNALGLPFGATQRAGYGLALAVVLVTALVRRRLAGRAASRSAGQVAGQVGSSAASAGSASAAASRSSDRSRSALESSSPASAASAGSSTSGTAAAC
jgi:hypothetical protein